jgi:hypothetical protein
MRTLRAMQPLVGARELDKAPETGMDQNAVLTAMQGQLLRRVMFLSFIALMLFSALEFAVPMVVRPEYVMKDFDAFYVAGRMFWEGRLADAYYAEKLVLAQQEIVHAQSFMPWTYPPHMNFLTAALSVVPIWVGYLFFTAVTFLTYLHVLRQVAPQHFGLSILFTFPAVLLCIRTGQNGFLIAALLGFFLLGIERKPVRSAAFLALLSIKPHFLLGAYLYGALNRKWRVLAGGLVGTFVLAVASTVAFGPEIWRAFLNSVREAGVFLTAGFYPLFRMISAYAALQTLGLAGQIALIVQSLIGLVALAMIGFAWKKGWHPRHVIAVSLMASLFVSPYAYDYDLQILGLSLGLLWSDLCRSASGRQLLILLAGSWLSAVSVVTSLFRDKPDLATSVADLNHGLLSLNFWALLFTCVYSLRLARRGA